MMALLWFVLVGGGIIALLLSIGPFLDWCWRQSLTDLQRAEYEIEQEQERRKRAEEEKRRWEKVKQDLANLERSQ